MEQKEMGNYFKYAIGEIALVMIGILLALQVNNWNEHRNLKNKTSSYLEALNKEVEKNIVLIKSYNIDTHNDIINSANTLRELHSEKAKYFNDSILKSVMGTKPIYKSILVRSTFDDLINSGVLEHLNNLELKNEILSIPAYIESIDENYNHAKDVWDDYQAPYLLKYSNVASNWDSIRGVKIEKPKFNETKEAFVYNKEYANILGLRLRMMGNYERNLSKVEESLITISEKIKAYSKENNNH